MPSISVRDAPSRAVAVVLDQLTLAAGLTYDVEEAREQRLEFWYLFNTAWLSALEKHLEMSKSVLDGEPGVDQTLLNGALLEEMGDTLINLCDSLERYGLVDYEMGMEEEKIVEGKCCIELVV